MASGRDGSGDPARRNGRPVTEVAVGILVRPDGAVLMADRPAGKPYAGYWEFPGGKIETGETVIEALSRELEEELGIVIDSVHPWLVREFNYPHAYVRLHFCKIMSWRGQPVGREGQHTAFVMPPSLLHLGESSRLAGHGEILPASLQVFRWLALPAHGIWLNLADALIHGPWLQTVVADSQWLIVLQHELELDFDPAQNARMLMKALTAAGALVLAAGAASATIAACVGGDVLVPELVADPALSLSARPWRGIDLRSTSRTKVVGALLNQVDFAVFQTSSDQIQTINAVPRYLAKPEYFVGGLLGWRLTGL